MISKYFSLDDVQKSRTATRLNIDNSIVIDEHYNAALELAINVLDPIKDKFNDLYINSWYRSFTLNKAVGGSSKSQHCFGQAADIESNLISNNELGKWIYSNIDFDQLIFEFTSKLNPKDGWVHVSYNKDNNRKEALLAYKENNTTKYRSLSEYQIENL